MLPFKATFAQALVVTRPLTQYMHDVSFVEVAQNRLRLRSSGLDLPDSRCHHTREEVALLNLRIVSGDAGRHAIDEYFRMLQRPQTDDEWFSDLGVSKQQSLHLMLLALCDAWRRLVLPFEAMPWQLFKVIAMEPAHALDYVCVLRREHYSTDCHRCSDELFSEAGCGLSIRFVLFCDTNLDYRLI